MNLKKKKKKVRAGKVPRELLDQTLISTYFNASMTECTPYFHFNS